MSRADELAAHFYEWENWGRGWHVAAYPADIEPPFEPFGAHRTRKRAVDDGRKPTFLSTWADSVFGVPNELCVTEPRLMRAPRVAHRLSACGALVELQIALPPQLHAHSETFDHFLCSLSYCSHPLSFEVIGEAATVTVQLTVVEEDADDVARQIKAHFPDVIVKRSSGILEGLWNDCCGSELAVVETGLAREFMLPLQAHRNFGNDPLVAMVGALSELQKHELAVFEVLFTPARKPWNASVMRSVTDHDGTPFFWKRRNSSRRRAQRSRSRSSRRSSASPPALKRSRACSPS